MRRFGRLLGVALLAGVAVVVVASPASACSCASWTDAEAFAYAQAVFTGVLVEVRTPGDGAEYSSADPERFVFDVQRVYKGDVHARQSVVTARGGSSCGLEISGSGPFVVYARTEPDGIVSGVDGELTANLCGGTRPLTAGVVPAEFGAGLEPTAGSSPIGSAATSAAAVFSPLLAGGLTVVAAALFVGARRRSMSSGRRHRHMT